MSRGLATTDDPVVAIEELADAKAPWLYGVRHHSPACAIALPPLLDALAPTAVAIELPADLAAWIPWLAHADAKAPLAVAAVSEAGDDLGFYPFADFSPELVALRWAREHDVPAYAIDLPAARRGPRDRSGARVGIGDRLRRHDDDDSWEHLVEALGVSSEPERVRRAALLYGWALRIDEARGDGVSAMDRLREQYMRTALGALTKPGARVAAIIGSFHAAALLPKPTLWSAPEPQDEHERALVSSLIPYAFDLLDSRSGYPAGIRDPMWQQRLWETQKHGGARDVTALVAACLVEITRGIRSRGLPASVPDARAAASVAISLASLRGLPAPGRRELIEGVQTALTHGELLGRGRVVARAMHGVLVGHRRGQLAPKTPRSGLAPHVHALFAELSLPGEPTPEPVDVRLDPLRKPIDRRRQVALARLVACGVPYATRQAPQGVAAGLESLTTGWTIAFTPATEAMIELAGLRGVTLRQAAAGSLRAERTRLEAEGTLTAVSLLSLTERAAEAGAGELVTAQLVELAGPRLAEATLAELIALISLLDRVLAGHVVALPADADDAVPGEIDHYVPPVIERDAVLSAAVASILGLAGSEQLSDVRALAELVRVLGRPEHEALGESRLRWSIDQLAQTGSPLIVGAASVMQVLVGARTAEELSSTLGGWCDAAVDAEARRLLAARLRGGLTVAAPMFESAPVFLDGLIERVAQLADPDFLVRAAALREGFDVLSTAARRRLLRVLGERLGETDARGLDLRTVIDPMVMIAAAEADLAGRAAIAHLARPDLVMPAIAHARAALALGAAHAIPLLDRWRMILGHERDQMQPRSARAVRALDELYGKGHGEGSRSDDGTGGQQSAFPTVRAWRDEIEELFGERVFEEVAGRAAERGRLQALMELDPASVTPSVELLEQVLSLKGGLGEAHLGRMRALIRRIVDELVRALAVRVRPALQGTTTQRATRRRSPTLHLARTVAANLAKVQTIDGEARVVPERLFFKEKSRRHLDWHVVLCVDVSGSMEPSVIYSALMSAILSAVPWIAVKFIAFSTQIVDLSEHVDDPLALLLEVSVGGGTHIAKALAYARAITTVPQRTIVITVSDFEEGFSVDSLVAEVRALVESGVTCLGLAALDDLGAPRYAVPIAERVAAAGMPVAALTPLELARWIGEKIK